jgi:hypothetical protein
LRKQLVERGISGRHSAAKPKGGGRGLGIPTALSSMIFWALVAAADMAPGKNRERRNEMVAVRTVE